MDKPSHREAEVPIWGLFGVRYFCRLAYDPEYDSISMVSARFARSGKNVPDPKRSHLYVRMMADPKLKSEVLLALFPDDPASVNEARRLAEKAKAEARSPTALIAYGVITALVVYGLFLLWLK